MSSKRKAAQAKGAKGAPGKRTERKAKPTPPAPTPAPAPTPTPAPAAQPEPEVVEGKPGPVNFTQFANSDQPLSAAEMGVGPDGKRVKQAKQAKPKPEGALPSLRSTGPAKPKSGKRKAKEPHPCICGCGKPTKSLWFPGHDARAKGWALRIERDVIKIDEVPANERAGAEYMLKVRRELGVQPGSAVGPKLVKGNATDNGEAAPAAAVGE